MITEKECTRILHDLSRFTLTLNVHGPLEAVGILAENVIKALRFLIHNNLVLSQR